jgi:hypothetical protein
VVGRRGENFGAEKRWKKKIHAGREDGIFVHPQNGFNGLILNWCIGGCWLTPALMFSVGWVPALPNMLVPILICKNQIGTGSDFQN